MGTVSTSTKINATGSNSKTTGTSHQFGPRQMETTSSQAVRVPKPSFLKILTRKLYQGG